MNTVEAVRLGEELGLDAVGVAPAEAYAETERHIVERRRRGLFAGMKFTMAQPERSCHPETLLDGARTVVSAALCYWEAETPLEEGKDDLRATPGPMDTRRWASGSTCSGAASAATTACLSMRTSTSTARPPPGAASGSTARTRC